MNNILVNTQDVANNEESVMYSIRPEFNRITYNPTRASIIHLLVKSKDLNHTSSVEEMAYKLGKRHSVIIHHLEKLLYWKIVDVVRAPKYGNKQKRSIWGLNLKYPSLIQGIYSHMIKTFYTQNELDKMCCVNQNIRKVLMIIGISITSYLVTCAFSCIMSYGIVPCVF